MPPKEAAEKEYFELGFTLGCARLLVPALRENSVNEAPKPVPVALQAYHGVRP